MLNPITRWFSTSTKSDEGRNEVNQLKGRITELERELQLHRKIKIVADLQHANVCKLLREQEQFQRLWLFTADAIQQVRDALSTTAFEGQLQLQQLAKTSFSQQRFNELFTRMRLSIDNPSADDAVPADVSATAIDELLKDFVHQTIIMAKNIEYSANKSFLVTAKLDHIIWKTEIYRLFWGKSDKTINDFADYSKSRLGQWYYQGDGYKLYHGYPAYRALESPQREVHEFGIEALNQAFQKDSAAAFKSLEKMEDASTRILQLLSELSTEIAVQQLDGERRTDELIQASASNGALQ